MMIKLIIQLKFIKIFIMFFKVFQMLMINDDDTEEDDVDMTFSNDSNVKV